MIEPPEEPTPVPLPPREALPALDYFAGAAPDRVRAGRVRFWSIVLAAGWIPYLCGVLNAVIAAGTYSTEVWRAHTGGAVLFLALGALSSLAAVVAFARMRHMAGCVAGGMVLVAQLAIVTCIGLAHV